MHDQCPNCILLRGVIEGLQTLLKECNEVFETQNKVLQEMKDIIEE